ncbi:MAG: class II aldolase/adducin family protein [Gemmatimonadetes bacterium]|nr:class II aldolase/adducin family protein [Gemmatimonadota bacterium]
MSDRMERDQIIDAARRTVALGLTHGTSGNVSARVGDGMAITPSGLDYGLLEREDLVVMDLDGTVAAGQPRVPSSEWRMHAAIYRARPEVRAVVHGHSPAATAVACFGRDIPPFHYMIAVAGGDSIRCAPYAPFGSDALAALAVEALTDRWACLLAHHGLLAAGTTMDQALAVASETEFLADLFLRLLPLGEPRLLSAGQLADVLERFRHYGQRGRGA